MTARAVVVERQIRHTALVEERNDLELEIGT
jgi:hypothetical protein